jgi:lipoprotein-anchoring transpeptidase ErfK/SrfK
MPLVKGTPCTTTAKACVDLDAQRAWLLDAGAVVRGPIRISSGGDGKETPVGHSLRVYRKEKDYKSQESRLPNGDPAPMPWAVFFEDGGIAFHGGDPRRASAGCIRMSPVEARKFFEFLQIGDQVQVVRGREERAARGDRETQDH